MAKYIFDITQDGQEKISISADTTAWPKAWKDITAPSILTFGVGTIDIQSNQAMFNGGGAGAVFELSGKPFDASAGDSGSATLEFIADGYDGTGWTWTLRNIT